MSDDVRLQSLSTFPRLLMHHAQARPNHPATREKDMGIWQTWTWSQVAEEVRAMASGLAELGFKRGDNLAIIGDNRPRLYWAMYAAQCLGGVPVPMYQDAVAAEMIFVLQDAGIKFAIVEDQEQVDKLLENKAQCPALQHVLYDDPRGMRHYNQPFLHGLDEVQEMGRIHNRNHPEFIDGEIALGQSEDVAVMLYTSGTTGKPKGVCQTHCAFIKAAQSGCEFDKLGPEDNILSYLPMAWVGDHLFSFAQAGYAGFTINCPESGDTVMTDMREIGPSYYFAPPRVFENLLTQVMIRMEDASAIKRNLFHYFMGVARRCGAEILDGKPVSGSDRLLYALGNFLVFGPLRNVLGMSRIRVAYTAGAAIGPDLFRFYRSIGVNLKQLYGSTETGFTVAMHRNGAVAPDSVGAPLDGVELAFTAGEEVLVRSPGLFREYLGNAEATRRARDEGGWFATGDIGRIGSDGQLRIIDRAGDVGTLTDGAFFSPRQIENRIKASPYVREAIALGAGRGMVCAMIDINTPAVGRWADGQGISFTGHADLASREEVLGLIAGVLAEANAQMARDPAYAACQVHRFLLLPKELDADDGVLTRTGKIRRDVVAERFAGLIEALYGGRDVAPNPFAGEVHGGDTEAGDVRIGDVRVVSTAGARRAA